MKKRRHIVRTKLLSGLSRSQPWRLAMALDLPFTLRLCADLPGMDSHNKPNLTPILFCSGHEDRAWQGAWNPAKPLLASCSTDKTVRLYSYRKDPHDPSKISFSLLTTIPTGHTKTVRTVAWSPSGNTLATGSFDSHIGIWERRERLDDDVGSSEAEEWECVTLLEGHETECKSVAYSSTGTLLATCSRDKSVWVWEGNDRTRLCHLRFVTGLSIAVKPDADFECLAVMMEHSQDVKCVSWHPTEEVVLTFADCSSTLISN